MSKDERKDFISQIIAQNFKNIKGSDLSQNSNLENFLNNGSCMTLFAFLDSSQQLHVENNVSIKPFLKYKSKSYIRGALNKFPNFFHISTFIDSTHMKL